METKLILETAKPLFSTYHYQMIPGVALQENPSGENWYLNECMMLQCGKRFLQGFTTPEVGVCRTEMQYIEPVEQLPYDLRFLKEDLHKLIKRMLQAGYYVVFEHFDDYYIFGKSFFAQRHWVHDGMICGYDEALGSYYVMAYDTNWVCRTFQTPQRCLERAMQFPADVEGGSRLIAVKAKDIELPFRLTRVKDGLKEYLGGTLKQHAPDAEGMAFGVCVNWYVGIYLDLLRLGDIPYEKRDRRVFRLLWEYRRCMQRRLEKVDEILHTSFEKEYAPLEKESNLMRMMYAKYALKRDDNLLLSLKKRLEALQQEEQKILERVIQKLEKEGY